MRSIYLRAVRYAEVLDPLLSRDHVHNAWLYHFDKTGKSLFEQPIGYVLWLTKIMFRREYVNRFRSTLGGEQIRRTFLDIEDFHQATTTTPEDILITNETIEDIYERVDNYNKLKSKRCIPNATLKSFLTYLEHGYSRKEIIDLMGLNHQTYHDYLKKLRTLMTDFHSSPFNGNKLPIKQKITRSDYENHKNDKYSDYVYDTDRWSDSNESYTQLTHKKDFYGILIVEGKRLDL